MSKHMDDFTKQRLRQRRGTIREAQTRLAEAENAWHDLAQNCPFYEDNGICKDPRNKTWHCRAVVCHELES